MSITTLKPANQWAQEEFAFAALGDQRLNKRIVKIATHLAASPGGTLPQAFPHWERTRRLCREAGEYLMIEDSTVLDYSQHPKAQDLGVIGDGQGRGFDLHTTLAVRVESWTLEQRPEGQIIGLFDQQCRRPRPAPRPESRCERLQRPRKSNWWADAFNWAGALPGGCVWIYVADRESDFYEPIETCQQWGVDFIIRGYQDRRLAHGAGKLTGALDQAPVWGCSTVELRSRGGAAARTAIVELRSVEVDLEGPWRPGRWQEPLRKVTVLEVREINPPEGVSEPLHWVLLTSPPCHSLSEARRIVGRYTARWLVEEYHKALKTGTGVEDSQLELGGRLEVLIAVLAVVAVRLLNTKMLARSRPDGVEAQQSFGPEAVAILEKKFGKPKGGWNNQTLLIATARLGGFLARKHDGMPGWQTIWRGWRRLIWMCEGLETINPREKTCG